MKKKIFIILLIIVIFLILKIIFYNYKNEDFMKNEIITSSSNNTNMISEELLYEISGDFISQVQFINNNIIYTGVSEEKLFFNSMYLMENFKTGIKINISDETTFFDYDTLEKLNVSEIENGDILFIDGIISYYNNEGRINKISEILVAKKSDLEKKIKENLINKRTISAIRLEKVDESTENRKPTIYVKAIIPMEITYQNTVYTFYFDILLNVSNNYINQIFEEKTYIEASDEIIIDFYEPIKELEVNFPIIKEIK